MASARTISKTDLARRTRQVVDQVRRGRPVIIESYGQAEAALIDIHDFRLFKAVTAYHTLPPHTAPIQNPELAPRGLDESEVKEAQAGGDLQAAWNRVMAAYLDGDISLGRAAELLDLSSFELRQRFNEVGIPLRIGPATQEEAEADIRALRPER